MTFPWISMEPRTDRQIVDETNDLARTCLAHLGTGFEAPDGHKFYEATDPRSRAAWQRACEIMEHMTATDPNDALANIEGEQSPGGFLSDHRIVNVNRYNEDLNRMEIAPNGDDYNAILNLLNGATYKPPREEGR